MTSWELIDLMLHYLDKGYIDNAKYVQDEILSRTYCTDPTMN